MKTSTLLISRARTSPHDATPRHQRGATLIVAMILLMIMSLLAITSLRASIQEERMSSASLDRNLAFQAAEASLRQGELVAQAYAQDHKEDLSALDPPSPTESCGDSATPDGVYMFPKLNCASRWENAALWHTIDDSDNTVTGTAVGAATFENGTGILSLAPAYIVELVDNKAHCDPTKTDGTGECFRFRITATSNTAGDRSKVVLQSIYATDGEAPSAPTGP
jgi:type IV pilus assembly protein PilX